MAKNMQPVLKRCRTLGVSPAAMGYSKTSNKNPGGQRRAKKSEYAMQLTEKQKVKFVYGMQERQFRSYYEKASRAEGNTGEVLLSMLERRVSSGLCFHPPGGPAAGEPWPLYRQWQAG
jgi:small subunit ribosomal protein S4